MAPVLTLRAILLPTSTRLTATIDASSNIRAIIANTTASHKPCIGCRAPGSINNRIFFALFAILGVFMVVGGLWFFFWAKNGGFRWEEGDWDDYKTAVLRRKGPDGKTISSRSTRMSSVSGEQVERARWAAKSVVAVDEKGRKGIMGKRGIGKSHSYGYRDDFTNYDGEYRDDITLVVTEPDGSSRSAKVDDMKQYRSEKAAKVGGMNRRAEGSHFEFSGRSDTDGSSSAAGKSKRRIKAERAAQEETERMEVKWREEAERVAAMIAKERVERASQTAGSKTKAVPRRAPTHAPRQARGSGNDTRSRSTGDTYRMYRPNAEGSAAASGGRRAPRLVRASMPGSFDG